jgi:hypothetical protein
MFVLFCFETICQSALLCNLICSNWLQIFALWFEVLTALKGTSHSRAILLCTYCIYAKTTIVSKEWKNERYNFKTGSFCECIWEIFNVYKRPSFLWIFLQISQKCITGAWGKLELPWMWITCESYMNHMWITCDCSDSTCEPHVFHMWVFTCVFFVRDPRTLCDQSLLRIRKYKFCLISNKISWIFQLYLRILRQTIC